MDRAGYRIGHVGRVDVTADNAFMYASADLRTDVVQRVVAAPIIVGRLVKRRLVCRIHDCLDYGYNAVGGQTRPFVRGIIDVCELYAGAATARRLREAQVGCQPWKGITMQVEWTWRREDWVASADAAADPTMAMRQTMSARAAGNTDVEIVCRYVTDWARVDDPIDIALSKAARSGTNQVQITAAEAKAISAVIGDLAINCPEIKLKEFAVELASQLSTRADASGQLLR